MEVKMKIILLRTVGVDGTIYDAGTLLELDETKANALIQMGKASANPEHATNSHKPGVVSDEKAKDTLAVSVAEATLPAIKKMNLSPEEVVIWLEAEKAGKKRKTVIEFLEKLQQE